VVEAEGDFFVLVVDGVTLLPFTVVVPDAIEVFLIDPVVEAGGGDFLFVVTGEMSPATGVVPNAVEVDLADSTLTNLSPGVFQNDFSVSMLLVE
jgi:hypothetical protein